MVRSIYLVDGSLTMRATFQSLIEQDAGLALCGMASTGETALAEIAAAAPEILLFDFGLPDMDGFAFLHRCAMAMPRRWTETEKVMLTAEVREAVRARAFAKGIAATIDKSQIKSNGAVVLTLLRHVGTFALTRQAVHGRGITLAPAARSRPERKAGDGLPGPEEITFI